VLDSSSKWIVSVAQTWAVVYRRDLVAPFLIIGAILAAFFAQIVKKIVNQQRPEGTPFTDPGMPSSHALVSAFTAVGWAIYLPPSNLGPALIAAALCVSVLRVVCGHHTWAQIGVGASFGSCLAWAWMRFGSWVLLRQDFVTNLSVYGLYGGLRVIFILRSVLKDKGRKVSKGASSAQRS